MPIKDPAKRREYHRRYMQEWYRKNAAIQVERNRQRRKKIRAWFVELKATLKCARCGENHPATLEFHHSDPQTKDLSLYEAVWSHDWGKARILAEVAKCTILCANCHRKHHWEEALKGEGSHER
jgi:transcription elongation factor Elf1